MRTICKQINNFSGGDGGSITKQRVSKLKVIKLVPPP